MTKARIMIIVLCATLNGVAAKNVYAQMTDDQVVKYVQQASKQGKSQTEISRELIAKGVTMDQVNRLKDKYANGQQNDSSAADGTGTSTTNPRQAKVTTSDVTELGSVLTGEDDLALQGETTEDTQVKMARDTSVIFGHDIFQHRKGGISFEPNENVATPENYRLGPGDEVVVDIWGYNEANIQQTITPEGKIYIEMIGPVYLTGLTVKEAESKIKKVLASKYSSIGGDRPNTEVSVSLGAIRTIQVNVMGDVEYPGAYRMSSFSTVFSALYAAGGVTDTGSLRAIDVVRNGKKIASVDIYAYIFDGKSTSDVRLQDGDVIVVPAYVNVVKALGGVKRSMKYELAAGETVADLLKYSGGFTGRAFRDNVSVLRFSGTSKQILTASKTNNYHVVLEDGDEVTVGVSPQHFANRLEVKGYVVNPGEYEYGGSINTVKQLVTAAGGLKEDAFLGRAVLQREKADRSFENLAVDIGGIMKGTRPDVQLRRGDVLSVRGIYEMQDRGILTINGQVTEPGVFDYADNTTIEDLIVLAGGLTDGASLAKVDVARRVADPNGLEVSEKIGETFTFSIKDGLPVDGANSFYLKPYDVVSVRKAPSHQDQKFVTVEGQVAFPGQYVLLSTAETISDLIARAGGVTTDAYLKGGLLIRKASNEDKTRDSATRRLMRQTADSLDVTKIDMRDQYTIGIDMSLALANPKSVDDLILDDGDRILIPEITNTVKIGGEVLYPNVVVYQPGKNLEFYINQAGGYGEDARRSKTYVVYMNGNVSKASNAKFEPGCEIVVPKRPERHKMSPTEILSIGTSTASLSTMIISMVNMLKK